MQLYMHIRLINLCTAMVVRFLEERQCLILQIFSFSDKLQIQFSNWQNICIISWCFCGICVNGFSILRSTFCCKVCINNKKCYVFGTSENKCKWLYNLSSIQQQKVISRACTEGKINLNLSCRKNLYTFQVFHILLKIHHAKFRKLFFKNYYYMITAVTNTDSQWKTVLLLLKIPKTI